MMISIWRYSHFLLAVSSSLFIAIACFTGIILAVEPVSNALEPYAITDLDEISLSETVENLQQTYKEVIDVTISDDHFVIASVITQDGNAETIYTHPKTGEKLGALIERPAIYEFATTLHRSLFLKSTGRFIVGIASLFLLLIICTGIVLIYRRQGGFKRFFSKVVYEDFQQYYHIQLGKISFLPILIVTLTGIYISLEKFEVIPSYEITHTFDADTIDAPTKQSPSHFPIFQEIKLQNVKKIEFPFSDDSEDYFLVTLHDREIQVQQYNGQIISEFHYPKTALFSSWSALLHTGKGNPFWAIILLLVCICILFFLYSGIVMSVRRLRNRVQTINVHDKDAAEYIILVGSESGSTYQFATIFQNALLQANQRVFVSSLNEFTSYEKAKHFIIFTATYGEGDAPTNASQFKKIVAQQTFTQSVHFSVVGFGSLAYPEFCQFAVEVDTLLNDTNNFLRYLPIEKIHNKSFIAFENWVKRWSKKTQLSLQIELPNHSELLKELQEFKVIGRTELNTDDTFLLRLLPPKNSLFQSGDLLAVYAENETTERLYSIGKIDSYILLSIKKHALGICSTYLSQLQVGTVIKGIIKSNSSFHIPNNAKPVIMIANGTGIGPFLGMIRENISQKPIHLFWGTRTKASFDLYKEKLHNDLACKRLESMQIAYSQEFEKQYVQDLLWLNEAIIVKTLNEKGAIMICGAIAMQQQVMQILEEITRKQLNKTLEEFIKSNQLLIDCY